jgi:phosphatidate cytidylyltransferase
MAGMNSLRRRSISAALFAAIMLGMMLWSMLSFYLLFIVIHAMCLKEYLELSDRFPHKQQAGRWQKWIVWITGIAIHAGSGYFTLFYQSENFSFVFFAALLTAALLMLAELMIRKSPDPAIGYYAFGLFYISFPLILLNVMVNAEAQNWVWDGVILPFGILLLIWVNDTAAYMAGTAMGKHKIAPSVSPNKSWEGFIVGLAAALLLAYFFAGQSQILSQKNWLLTGAVVSIAGTTGDFFESWLKRKAGVKDSGSIMPGHGGLLDRFDAFIFCLPFIYLVLFLN